MASNDIGNEKSIVDESRVAVASGNEITEEKNHQFVTETGHNLGNVESVVHRLADKLGDGQDAIAPVTDIEHVMDKIETLTVEECRVILVEMLEYHEYDYNFAQAQRDKISRLLDGPTKEQSTDDWELELKTETAVCKFFSPYPEVRAITEPFDDLDMPAETIRAHLLGYIWAVLSQFNNSLFNSRWPQILVSSVVIQVLLYPCGLLLAYILPDWGFNFRGKRVSLNPGPWSYKEQVLSTIIVDVGLTSAYCFWNIQTQTIYYQDKWLTPGYGILLLLSTQLMGLGFSGLMRRFVVYPVEAIWPSILPTLALNRALLLPDSGETVHGWRMSRYKFFFIFFLISFFYYWLPGYLFTGLTTFAWMAWIKKDNFNLAVVTGGSLGLGFNPIASFDWNTMTQLVTLPLAWPWFATAQQYAGQFFSGLIILALYYSNTAGSAYLPPNTSGIFDNTGAGYNITRILYEHTAVVNQEAYEAYSPPFYGAGNLVLYGAFFAFYPLTMVFILLDAWRPLLRAYKSMGRSIVSSIRGMINGTKNFFSELSHGNVRGAFSAAWNSLNDGTSIYDDFDDPLTNVLRSYPEVPDWWFLVIAFVAFIFAIIILTHWPQLDTPVWTIFFVIGLNLVFLIPMSYLYAISGTTEGLNVVTELIVGYALPGHPEALMFVKAFGYNINGQADNYISDQKMGYYAKLPPRAMYRGQVISAVITAFVAYGVVQFADNSIPGICTPTQASKFTCAAGSKVYFSSSVVWGAIGPARIFSQIYPAMKYCFLLGFLLALFWWTTKRYGPVVRSALQKSLPSAIFKPVNLVIFTPISWFYNVHPSLFFNGMLWWAPYSLTYSTGALYFSFAFMWYLRQYKTAWWEKYNYVLSAALTGGVALSGIIIFFALQYHEVDLPWWGNTVALDGVDGGAEGYQGALYTNLPTRANGQQFFGPETWH